MGGQYSEITNKPGREAESGQTKNSANLVEKCISYSKLRVYDKLFTCVGLMESNIAKGDKVIELPGLFSWNYPENISALPELLKAEAYIDFGDYQKAIKAAKDAYDMLPSIGWTGRDKTNAWERRYRIRALGLLALAHALSGDREAAEKLVAELDGVEASTYEFWMTPGGVSTAISKEKHFMLARANMSLGRYDRVLSVSSDSWDVFGSLSEGIVGYSMFAFVDLPREFMIGKALYETGKEQDAKVIYDRLLSKPETRSNGEIYWLILFDCGRIAEKQGNLKEATGYYRKAVDVIEQQRSTINTETSKIGFVGDKQEVYRHLIAALFSDGQYDAAFEYVERSKSRALVDMLAAKKNFAVESGDPAKVKQLLAMADNADSEAMQQGIDPKNSKSRSLVVSARQQLSEEAPDLASLVNVSSMATADIQKLIPQNESLVEFYYDAPYLVAFVLTNKGLKASRLDGTGLQENIRQFRKDIENPNSNSYLILSRRLYDHLFRPLTSQINTKKLIIVAHGPLHYLPFNALNDGQGYLIDRYSLRMLPSASVLKFLRATPVNKPGNILAFGNPDLGNPMYDLVHAQAEAIAVTRGKPESKVLLRKAASESAFLKYGSDFRYLHFATHGEFNADAPLKSALLLAGDDQNNGLLTVDKLYSLRLDDDLVTLSACETGLGKVANGDDVVGLTRGFLYAGSRSIVASLWQVDDLATSYLMTRFYDNLQHTDKREALREAQLETRKKYAHPYYWAAFQITGSAQ